MLSNFSFLKLIIFLFPFSFLTGPFLPDFLIVLMSIISIYFLYKNQFSDFYINKLYLIFFLTFFFIIILSSLLSQNILNSLIHFDGPIFYFRYLFFIIFIQQILIKDFRILKLLYNSILISTLFLLFDGIFQWIFSFDMLGIKNNSIRVTGVFGSEEILGHYLGFIAPILYILNLYFFKNTSKLYILINILILLFCLFVTLISGDRTGLLKLTFFLIAIFLFDKSVRKYLTYLLLIFIFISVILINSSQNLKFRYSETVNQMMDARISFIPFNRNHENHIIGSYRMFIDKPLIGHGPQGFRLYCKNNINYNFSENVCNNHPHNYYFQSLAELGILGFVLILGFYLYLCLFMIKRLSIAFISKHTTNLESVKSLFLSHLLINFFPLMPHFNFYNNWTNSLLFLNISLVIYFFNLRD